MKNERLHELALRAKSGDEQAVNDLLVDSEIRKLIYMIVNEKGFASADADDIYQDVLLKIVQKIASWQGRCEVLSWIGRITRNTCIDVLRKNKSNWIIVTDSLPESQSASDHLQEISARQMLDVTVTALDTLPEECRQFMRLHFWEGLTKSELMERVNLTKTTFYRRWKSCYQTWMRIIQKIVKT